ncbi:MAG: hypothetical protein ACI9MJ_002469, partial [Alphaproteobacteria bacterium]
RTVEWMKGWGFLETMESESDLVNLEVQEHGYQRAPEEVELESKGV